MQSGTYLEDLMNTTWAERSSTSTPAALQREFFEMLETSQWWPAHILEDYQRKQLSWLIEHTRANVPFYQSRLDVLIRSDGEIDWDRWAEVPIVTRRDMIEHRHAMQAREFPASHGPTATTETSGSTGVAIAVTVNRLAAIANAGLIWRCHSWHGLDWGRNICTRAGTDARVGAFPHGQSAGAWGPPWVPSTRGGVRWIINKFATGEEALRFFSQKGCSYLGTGPTVAQTLALDARRLGMKVSIDAVLCFGEAVRDDVRAVCDEVFGARIVEMYSSKEGAQIAHACPSGTLHINGEAVLVEIVDDNGRPCAPGELGRVVITPFFSTVQPLIRYDQGDLAVAGTVCSCGRASPVLATIAGRKIAIFRHPDGRVAARVLPMEARHALHCEFMQLAQVGPNDYEVRYVPNDEGLEPDEAGFLEHFRRMYFDDATVTFRRVSELAPTPAGKLLEYVNEWHGQPQAVPLP